MSNARSPVLLKKTVLEKVWGSPNTIPWYENTEGKNIGEIWFHASDAVPILVKFLFTSDNLSIQVHPRGGAGTGKTEMWHILRAEGDARIGVGLKRSVTTHELHAGALNGAIVDMLEWIPAEPGDTFFTPAGTIHALGGGLTLCEIQQKSDITYRLYDWGRAGRELHLDQGIAVSNLEPSSHRVTPQKFEKNHELLVHCEYFRTEWRAIRGRFRYPVSDSISLVVVLAGAGEIISGNDSKPFQQGEVWEVPANATPFEIASREAIFLQVTS